MSERVVSASTTIEAAPSVVFDIVANPYEHPRIDGSGSVQAGLVGPERLSRGAEFGVSMRLFGVPYTIKNRVVEFEEDRRIAWRHFGAHRWRYELEPTDDGGTSVTETWDASRYQPLVFRALALLGFPERNRHGITATLVRLKQEAEARA